MFHWIHDLFTNSDSIVATFSILAVAWSTIKYMVKPLGRWFTRKAEERRQMIITIQQNAIDFQEIKTTVTKILAETKIDSGSSMRDMMIRIERKLEENTILTRQSLDLTSAIAFICNPDGYCVWVSMEWSRITGLDISDAEGSKWTAAIYEADRDRVYRGFMLCCQEGRPFQSRYRYHNAKADMITWVNVEAAPKRNGSGEITFIFGHATVIDDPHYTVPHEKIKDRIAEGTG
jgi:PAS domain S-box-containing protein